MNVAFHLGDGERTSAEHPRSFFIPARTRREAVSPGELVKLLFEIETPDSGLPSAERMWVEVVSFIDGEYVGTLDNEPKYIDTLSAGDVVTFRPEHIISIWEDRPELDRKVAVSRRSHVEDLRPQFVVREEPLNPSDSGWQALVGDETEDELENPDNVLFQALGFVLDRWPELAPVFADTGKASQWEWDEASARYHRLPASS